MTVWLATLRRGSVWHHLREDGRYTICGRPSFHYGYKLVLEEIPEKATECRTCSGDNPRYPRDAFTRQVA